MRLLFEWSGALSAAPATILTATADTSEATAETTILDRTGITASPGI
jgi:hypothetical protein